MPYADIGTICLYYQDTGPPAAGLDGPPVLLLHELGGQSESWRAAIAILAARRRVIAMDFRGAGRSEKPVAAFPLEVLADDAAALLTSIGIGGADVIGAALGSLVGLLLAGRHPAMVRSLSMFAVAADMSGKTASYLRERAALVRREGMRAAVDTSLANAFPDRFAEARARYRPIYLGNDINGYAAMSLALAGARLDHEVWVAVRVPTLVVSGAHDFIWPPPLGREAAARIAGARFEIMDDAAHFPHVQAPAALVARFLSAQTML